jgi:hypothetical protein
MGRQEQKRGPSPIQNRTVLCGCTIGLEIRRSAVDRMAILGVVRINSPTLRVYEKSLLSEFGSLAIAFAILGALPKFKSKVGSPLQLLRASEISNVYWRNWLSVVPTICPQTSIVAKVSRPLKTSQDDFAFVDLLCR